MTRILTNVSKCVNIYSDLNALTYDSFGILANSICIYEILIDIAYVDAHEAIHRLETCTESGKTRGLRVAGYVWRGLKNINRVGVCIGPRRFQLTKVQAGLLVKQFTQFP